MAQSSTNVCQNPEVKRTTPGCGPKVLPAKLKGKATATSSEVRCELCNRDFNNVTALRMHLTSSKAHKVAHQYSTSASRSITPGTANAQLVTDKAPAVTYDISKAENITVRCELCRLSFKNVKALQRHKRYSPVHHSHLAKAQMNGISARVEIGRRSSVLTRSSSLPPQSRMEKDAPNQKVHCVTCDRSFQSAEGLIVHVRNSKKHKARLEMAAGNGEVKQVDPSSSLPHQGPVDQNLAKKKFCCLVCNRLFETEKGFHAHVRTSKDHKAKLEMKARDGKTKQSHQSSTLPHQQSIDTVISEGRVHCVVCNRHFDTSEAFQVHVRDCHKHEAKMQVDARNGDLRQHKPILPTPSAKNGHLREEKRGAEITKQSHEPVDPLKSTAGMILRAAGTTYAPSQISDRIGPVNDQHIPEKSYPKPNELQAIAVPVQNTAGSSHHIWSDVPIHDRQRVIDVLRKSVHSVEDLSKSNYWIRPFTLAEIDGSRKCNNCGLLKKRFTKQRCRFHPMRGDYEQGILRGQRFKYALCPHCKARGGKGCVELQTHNFAQPDAKLHLLKASPPSRTGSRAAVAVDCEMVGILVEQNTMSEVVRLCAVDFITAEVLVDTYVTPEGHVVAWRSSVSGVTKTLLNEMKQQGRTVNGWQAARKLLWQHIDENTVLIGHSLHNDLSALGMIHTRVIDTAIVSRSVVGQDCNRSWALKTLCDQFLGRKIQTGTAGHDCLEDTFATREVLLWCLQNPDQLQRWADSERNIIKKKKAEQLAAKKAKEKEKVKQNLEGKDAMETSSAHDNISPSLTGLLVDGDGLEIAEQFEIGVLEHFLNPYD